MPRTLTTVPCSLYPPSARYHNSALSIWLSVDPMSDKYPSTSPYTYCGNNPVRLVDPNGETFVVADNEESHTDILSIVEERHRDRVIFEKDGTISVNRKDLSDAAFQDDIGLTLINDLAESDKKYYYETADFAFCKNESGERMIYNTFTLDCKGVLNASNFGKDSNGKHGSRPMEGFDGQVGITKSGQFKLYGRDCRKEIVFHELRENFLRTDFGWNYYATGESPSAHDNAAKLAFQKWGGQQGVVDEYIMPTMQPAFPKQALDYLNGTIK